MQISQFWWLGSWATGYLVTWLFSVPQFTVVPTTTRSVPVGEKICMNTKYCTSQQFSALLVPVPGEQVWLRERKKLATRVALGQAAWRLTIELGYEHARVEDIAAAAGVSARTFNNYFSSKEDALLSVGADRGARMVAALRARPEGEPLWDALAQAVSGQFAGAGEVPRAYARSVSFPRSSQLRSGGYTRRSKSR